MIETMLAFHHKKLEYNLSKELWRELETMSGGAIFEEFRKEILEEAKKEVEEKAKREKALEAAEKMVILRLSDETIIEVTGITKQELKEIKRKINKN